MSIEIFLFDWLEVSSWCGEVVRSQHNYKSSLVTAPALLWSRHWLSLSSLRLFSFIFYRSRPMPANFNQTGTGEKVILSANHTKEPLRSRWSKVTAILV